MISKDCPIRWIQLKVTSVDRSLLKGEAPRFFADFTNPLSSERSLSFYSTQTQALGINKMIAMSDINFHSLDRDMDTDMYMDAGTKNTDPWISEMDKDIEKDMEIVSYRKNSRIQPDCALGCSDFKS